MKPVRTAACNLVYRGDDDQIGDLHCCRVEDGTVEVVWEPTEVERAMLAAGGRVIVSIYREPIPPMAVWAVAKDDSEPIGPHPFYVLEGASDEAA